MKKLLLILVVVIMATLGSCKQDLEQVLPSKDGIWNYTKFENSVPVQKGTFQFESNKWTWCKSNSPCATYTYVVKEDSLFITGSGIGQFKEVYNKKDSIALSSGQSVVFGLKRK